MSTSFLSVCLAGLLSFAALPSTLASPAPIWPGAFSAPFGLYNIALRNPIVNATSTFYYDFTHYQAQLIDYPTRCVPILPGGELSGCRLLFRENIYFSQPSLGVNCCTLFDDVGPSPPAFLDGFTFNGTALATDYYGTSLLANYWAATPPATGFAYWTDMQTGHDLFFRDGDSGSFWAWGKFKVEEQEKQLFDLPGSKEECETSCFASMKQEAMKHEMMVKRVMGMKKQQQIMEHQ